MSWPPPGSKPPVPPRPAPNPTPRPAPVSPPASPGAAKVKQQANATAPQPPQFGHDGIDPRRAALILGLPLLAAAGTLLVLFASPLVWWIAATVAAAGVAGGVLLRRSSKARGALRRLPGAGRVTSALRRTSNGRFARTPLGRAVNRALGRRPTASPGGASSRPKTLGGKLRSMLPPWAGGTRKPSSSTGSGGSGKASPGGRMRSMLSRLKPGAGRRPGSSGSTSPSGAKPKTGGLLGRAARSVGKATGKASRAVGSKLFRIRPNTSPGGGGGSSKPSGRGKNKPPGGGSGGGGGKPGAGSSLDLGVVWTGLGASGRLVGRGVGALYGRWKKRKKTDTEDDFDPDSTYEIGIDGEVIDGKHTDAELGEIANRVKQEAAKRALKLAKKRAKEAKKAAKETPEWPNLDIDDVPETPAPVAPQVMQPPPDYEPDLDDYDDYDDAADRSLPTERDHDPPTSPPSSPASHRETRREEPRITSTNTTHGGNAVTQQTPKITQQATPSGISASNYKHHITTTPDGRATGWGEAADHARRDSVTFDQKADKKIAAAEEFERTGNLTAADDCRMKAAELRQDASTCSTIAGGYQDEANKEATSAA